jgi:hypothetical protein
VEVDTDEPLWDATGGEKGEHLEYMETVGFIDTVHRRRRQEKAG